MTALFNRDAPIVMADLMRDFGLTSVQAAGILGNIGRECGGFTDMVEDRGSGRGMCQWSSTRGAAFLSWCKKLGKPISDLDANYTFLRHELQSTERGAILAVKRQKTIAGATKAFMDVFERPGVPALSDRVRWANLALAAYEQAHGIKHAAAGPHPIHTPAYHEALAAHHATLARHHTKTGGHHG
jgi:hypothetical protein